MAKKFLKHLNGATVEEETVTSSAGAASADKIPSLGGDGRFNINMMPPGIGADNVVLPTTEALVAGDFVNIYDNAGTPACRKADASNAAKRADAYVLEAVPSGQNATLFFDESNNQVAGQTAGIVFLSATNPGKSTSVVPSATGNISQRLGIASSAINIHVNIQAPITLA